MTAGRTGVPVAYDYEVNDQEENRKGAWLAILAIAVAFAVVLQMESEQRRPDTQRMVTSRMATVLESS